MAKILIVEDDPNIRLLLKKQLEHAYEIEEANNGTEAFKNMLSHPADLIITDIMMPKMDGYSLVEKLRKDNFETPILMLTAKTTITSKIKGFKSGSDDYLTKPVNLTELELRVTALLRRAKINTSKKLKIGITIIDENDYSIQISTEKQILPKKEFELLFKLFSYPKKIFTQYQLLDEIWGKDNFSSEDTVKTHISKIRKVIKNSPDIKIKTIRGLGYQGIINASE